MAATTVVAALAASAPLIGWAPFGRRPVRVPVRQSQVTFTRDVAPILFSACASCHRPEGVAPFSLLTYDDSRKHAAAIVAATRDRVMPPWKPEPGYGEFLDERRLTREQIATLQRWFDGGLVEGDPALLPRPPTWTGQWQLGTPDLVIETAPYTLRASGDDVYRNFVLPIETSTHAVHQGVGIPARLQRSAPRHDAVRSHALVAAPGRAGSRARLRRARPSFGDEPGRILPRLVARSHVERGAARECRGRFRQAPT